MIVYVAGAYRGDVDQNIENARAVAIELWEKGFVALCPHLNTAHFEQDCDVHDEVYLEGDLELLARCDAIVLLESWGWSAGATQEKQFAEQREIPVYYYPDLPGKSMTEINRPIQSRGFIDIIMKMYRIHLKKNSDYSPANIAGPGELGIATRIWDKITRMMNLLGWRIEIASSKFEAPLNAQNEPLDDAYLDLSVYGIIGFMFRKGMWGK